MAMPKSRTNYLIEYFCETIFPLQALVGFVGNVLTIVVLLSRPMRSRTNTLLASAAVADIMFLLFMLLNNLSRWRQVVYTTECPNSNQTMCYTLYAEFYIQYKQHFTFACNWFSAASSWLMVAVSFDRLWAIKSPFTARLSQCSLRDFSTIPLIFMLTAAANFHMNFLSIPKVESPDQEMPQLSLSRIIMILMNIIIIVFLPMILLIGLNSFLLYYLRNRRQFFDSTYINRESRYSSRSTASASLPPLLEDNLGSPTPGAAPDSELLDRPSDHTSSWGRQMSNAERHVTITVIAIVTAYVITHLPSAFLYANLYFFHLHDMYKHPNSYTLVALSTMVVVSGKVGNFFLYCMSSKHFRQQMFMRMSWWGKEMLSHKESVPRTRSLPLNMIGDSNHSPH